MAADSERDESMKQQRRIQLGARAKLVLIMGELLLFLLLAQSVLFWIQNDRMFASAPRSPYASISAGQEDSTDGAITSEKSAGKITQTDALPEPFRQERAPGILRIAGVVLLIVFFHLSLAKILRGKMPTAVPYL